MELTKDVRDNIVEAIQSQKENIDQLSSLTGENQLQLAYLIVKEMNPILIEFSAYVGNSDDGDYFICLIYGRDDGSDWYPVNVNDMQVTGNHQIVICSDEEDYIYLSDHFHDLED